MDIRNYFKVTKSNDSQEATNIDNQLNNDKSNNDIAVFVDGSVFNNGKKNAYGGIGIYFSDNDSRNISKKLEKNKKISNNIAEIIACIEAIKIIVNDISYNENNKIIIYSDSEYTINCITKWSKLWIAHDWQRPVGSKLMPIKNKDLIIELYILYYKYKCKFVHVKSHQIQPLVKTSVDYFKWNGNMMADKLAKKASGL